MFCRISGAHSGLIFRICSEFGPGPIQDLNSYSRVFVTIEGGTTGATPQWYRPTVVLLEVLMNKLAGR